MPQVNLSALADEVGAVDAGAPATIDLSSIAADVGAVDHVSAGRPPLDLAALADSVGATSYEPLDLMSLADEVGASDYDAVEPEQPEAEPASGPVRFLQRIRDVLIAGQVGAVGTAEAAIGLVDIPTGGKAGKALDSVGASPKRLREALESFYSEQQQSANRSVKEADGIIDTVVKATQNPSVILNAVVQSAPLMVGGMGIARTLARVGMPVVGAAGVGEGLVTAGAMAESTRQESETGLLTPGQALTATASGALTGVLGAIGGRIATSLGIPDVDTLMAAAVKDKAVRTNLSKAIVFGAVQEGFLEELPQSVQEQVAANLAGGKPWSEGVDEAAVLGAFAGALMGAGGQVGRRRVLEAIPEAAASTGAPAAPVVHDMVPVEPTAAEEAQPHAPSAEAQAAGLPAEETPVLEMVPIENLSQKGRNALAQAEAAAQPPAYVDPEAIAAGKDLERRVRAGESPTGEERRAVEPAATPQAEPVEQESEEDFFAKAEKRIQERQETAKALASQGESVKLEHPTYGTVIAGPDMSKPGRFRWTRFDKSGEPTGHTEAATLEAAIVDAMTDGYVPATDAIRTVAEVEVKETAIDTRGDVTLSKVDDERGGFILRGPDGAQHFESEANARNAYEAQTAPDALPGETLTQFQKRLRLSFKQAHRLYKPAASVKPLNEIPATPEAASDEPTIEAKEIPRDLAVRAYSGTSVSPEQRADGEQGRYVEHLQRVWKSVSERATTPEQKASARTEFEQYRQAYRKRYIELLNRRTGMFSAMIAGPANFPVRQQEKKGEAYQKAVTAFLEWDKRARKAMGEAVSPTPPASISSDRDDAVEALQAKVKEAKAQQEAMKAINVIVRNKKLTDDQKVAEIVTQTGFAEATARKALEPDFAGRRGFPDYAMKNNAANIKRIEDRIASISATKATAERSAMFEGGRIEENASENRIQVFFDSKPDDATLAKLKANGFKWAPSQGAWQRLRNDNAVGAAERLFGVTLAAPQTAASQDDGFEAPVPAYTEEASDGEGTAAGQRPQDAGQEQPPADEGRTVEGPSDGDSPERRRLPSPLDYASEAPFRRAKPAEDAKRLTPTVARELQRIADELGEFQFQGRTWSWIGVDEPLTGNAAGGHANIVGGAPGAPVYDDILQFAPLNKGRKAELAKTVEATRAQVETAIRKVLEAGTIHNNIAEGAVRVAERREADDYRHISHPSLPPSWGEEASVEFTDELSDAIDEVLDSGEDGDISFDPEELEATAATTVDTLDTGEEQPRLPEAGAVREQNVETPAFEAPFSLTEEADTSSKGRQQSMFGSGAHGESVGLFDEPPSMGTATIPERPTTAHPMEFPELIELAQELGTAVRVQKTFRKAGKLGEWRSGSIKLVADLFTEGNEFQLAAVIAHEIGHAADFIPLRLMRGRRVNLLGRIRSLKTFMKQSFTAPDGTTITNAAVKAELLKLSKKWRPWDPKTESDSYNRYRESSSELYADALSVLLVNPVMLKTDAPTFYEMFFEYLDRKPEVERAYFDLQEVLSGTREELVARRLTRTREMFERGDVRAMEIEERRRRDRRLTAGDLWFHLKDALVSRNYAVIDRVRDLRKQGVVIPDDENPVYLLRELRYLPGKLKGFTERTFAPMYRSLNEAGVPWNAFGQALLYERVIAGDRSEIANPQGKSPESAQEEYDALLKQFDAEQTQALRNAMATFRAAVKEVAEAAWQAGLYSDDQHAMMMANPAYATFQVIEHLEKNVTSRVYQQIGTTKDITNPATASLIKTLVTIRALEYNLAKKGTLELLARHFPDDVKPAKTKWSGRGMTPVESHEPNEKLATYFEHGKLVGRYVEPYIAQVMEGSSIGTMRATERILDFVTGAPFFRPLFTSVNLGFQTFNVFRDVMRTWAAWSAVNPTISVGASIPRILQRYGQAVPLARARAFGVSPDSSADVKAGGEKVIEAEEAGILSVTFNDIIRGETDDTQIEKTLAQLDVAGFHMPGAHPFVKPFKVLLQGIKELGDFIETVPKAAAILEAEAQYGSIDAIPANVRDDIRRKIGSPDFLERGSWTPVTNRLFLFSNAIIQGWAADVEVATEPKTKAGFWTKTALVNFLPKFLLLAGIMGLGGAALRRYLEKVTEYDRTNYLIVPIPLSEDESGQIWYVRLPQSDIGRFMGGVLWKGLQMARGDAEVLDTATQVLDYTAGALPSIAPLPQAITATGQMIAGQNPRDPFRGRNVLTMEEEKAGGAIAWKKFLGWEFQQLGGGIIWRFYPGETQPRKKSPGQHLVELPIVSNVVGRFVRKTNYGEVERLQQASRRATSREATRRLNERTEVYDAVRTFQDLPAEQRTPGQVQRLAVTIAADLYAGDAAMGARRLPQIEERLRRTIARGDATPLLDALLSATSQEQRAEVIKTWEATFQR